MFESARLKLERAYQHSLSLETGFASFAYVNPHRAMIKFDQADGRVSRVWVEIEATAELPSDFGLSLGDSVHNMRCALDHVAWELIGIDGGVQDRSTYFPIGDTRDRFEAAVRAFKTPRLDTKHFLTNLGAFPDGPGKMLYAIHKLDNADKHHAMTPVLHASQVEGVTFIKLATGERERRGPLFTTPVRGMRAKLIEAAPDEGVAIDEPIDPIPELYFGSAEVVGGEPIAAGLAWFYSAVETVIDGAERLVKQRL